MCLFFGDSIANPFCFVVRLIRMVCSNLDLALLLLFVGIVQKLRAGRQQSDTQMWYMGGGGQTLKHTEKSDLQSVQVGEQIFHKTKDSCLPES